MVTETKSALKKEPEDNTKVDEPTAATAVAKSAQPAAVASRTGAQPYMDRSARELEQQQLERQKAEGTVSEQEAAERMKGNTAPSAAGNGEQLGVGKAGPREGGERALQVINRTGTRVRVIAERQVDGKWERDTLVNLQTDDLTTVIVENGRRVVIDTVEG